MFKEKIFFFVLVMSSDYNLEKLKNLKHQENFKNPKNCIFFIKI